MKLVSVSKIVKLTALKRAYVQTVVVKLADQQITVKLLDYKRNTWLRARLGVKKREDQMHALSHTPTPTCCDTLPTYTKTVHAA